MACREIRERGRFACGIFGFEGIQRDMSQGMQAESKCQNRQGNSLPVASKRKFGSSLIFNFETLIMSYKEESLLILSHGLHCLPQVQRKLIQ